MTYKEVRTKLHGKYLAILDPLGFKGKLASDGSIFTRDTDYGFNDYSSGIVNYIDEFKTSCAIGLSNKRIERVLTLAMQAPEIYSGGIGYRYADYLGVVNFDFTIRTDEDIDRWMVESGRFIHDFALPFYEKYKTVEAIDKLLNEKPRLRLVYAQFSERIIYGLVAANLNGNAKYEELLEIYWDEVNVKIGLDNFQVPKIKKVMDFLRAHTKEEIMQLSLTNAAV